MTSDNASYDPPAHALRDKVAAGAAWTSALHLSARAIELVFVIVLARLLTPAAFGVVAAAMVFVQFARLFVELGVGAALIQAPVLSRKDVRTAGTLIAASGIFFFAVTQLCAPLAAAFFNVAEVESVLRALAFMFLIQAIGVAPESLLVRRLEAPKVMAVEAAAKLVGFGAVGVGCALSGLGFWSLAFAALGEAFIKATALFLLVRPPVAPMLHGPSVGLLLSKGAGFSISRLFNFAALSADKLIAGRVLGPAGLGLYGRAYNLMSLPADLYGRIAERLVFPALAAVQTEPARLKRAFLAGVSLTATLGLPLSAILFVIAPELIRGLFGPQWVGAIAPFAILAAASFFRLGAKISGSLLRATGAFTSLILAQASYALLIISTSLAAAPHGLEALALAVSVSAGVFYLLISACACVKTRTAFAAFTAAHGRGALLAILVGVPFAALIAALRAWGAPDFATLLIAGGVSTLVATALVTAAPKRLLGAAGADLAIRVRATAVRALQSRGLAAAKGESA